MALCRNKEDFETGCIRGLQCLLFFFKNANNKEKKGKMGCKGSKSQLHRPPWGGNLSSTPPQREDLDIRGEREGEGCAASSDIVPAHRPRSTLHGLIPSLKPFSCSGPSALCRFCGLRVLRGGLEEHVLQCAKLCETCGVLGGNCECSVVPFPAETTR